MVCSKNHFMLSMFALRVLAESLWLCFRNENKFWNNSFNEIIIKGFFPSCRRKQSSQTPFKARDVPNSAAKPNKSRGDRGENSSMCCWFAQGLVGLCWEQPARHLGFGKARGEQGVPSLGRAAAASGRCCTSPAGSARDVGPASATPSLASNKILFFQAFRMLVTIAQQQNVQKLSIFQIMTFMRCHISISHSKMRRWKHFLVPCPLPSG